MAARLRQLNAGVQSLLLTTPWRPIVCRISASSNYTKYDSVSKTLYVKNLADSVTKDSLSEFFPDAVDIRLSLKSDAPHAGYAHVVFENTSKVEEMLKEKQGSELEGNALYLEHSKPPRGGRVSRAGFQNDRRKSQGEDRVSKILYVKNLADSVTKDSLSEFFPDAVEIRLSSKPRAPHAGYAHIVFENTSKVEEMLKEKQGSELEGNALYLEHSKSPRGGRVSRGGFRNYRRNSQGAQGLKDLDRKCGVFVSNIKKKTTPEEVKNVFSSFGTVDVICRPPLRAGRHVDLEFKNPSDAKSAVDELYIFDSIQIKDEKTVRVNNAKIGASIESVKKNFIKYGPIVSCSELLNYRNYAFVYFKTESDVKNALQESGIVIDGNKVQVLEMKDVKNRAVKLPD